MTHRVYRYGQKVLIGVETCRIEGTVIACEFRGPDYSKLIYCVSWWNDRDHKCEWFEACEVEAADESDTRAVLTIEAAK